MGTVHVAKYAAIQMAKNQGDQERGLILMVSSTQGKEGARNQVAYSATKGAINGMVMPMARDLGKFKIRVAAIAPGFFTSPMTTHLPEKSLQILSKETPLGRVGSPHEFADLASSMIENSYVNGVVLKIDGAQRASL